MRKAIIIMCLLTFSAVVWGQTGFNPRSIGMAGAYQSMAQGAEVSSWNPANLAMDNAPMFSLDVLNTAFMLTNNTLSISFYNEYLSQDYFDAHGSWDDAAKSAIVDQIPSDGLRIANRMQLTTLAFSYRRSAVALNSFVYADFNLPQEFIKIPLEGLPTETMSIDKLEGESIAGTEVALSTARYFKSKWDWAENFTVGATLKLEIGHAYFRMDRAAGSMLSSDDSIAINWNYRMLKVLPFDDKGSTGMGFGFDIGGAAQINDKLAVGLSLHNVLGSISFNGCEESRGSFAFDQPGINLDEIDNINEYFQSFSTDTTFISKEKIKYELPKSMLLSANYLIQPKIAVEMDYHQGLNKTAGGTTTPRLALGTELRYLSHLPVRLGFALGGVQGTTFGFGLGLKFKPYELDLAVSNTRGFFNKSKGLSFAIGQRIFL
ncbi:MAG: DUF5723 family protein [bacterium]|nr:DUF5723 family protein [bacterium]